MKKITFILSILAIMVSSCEWGTKKRADNNDVANGLNNTDSIGMLNADSVLTSPIRPNEKLRAGVSYIDTLEFFDYNDEGDFLFFVMKKGDQYFHLLDGRADWETYPGLNRGDKVEIQWNINYVLEVIADEEFWEIEQQIIKIEKVVEEGRHSIFQRTNKKSIVYTFMDDFTDTAKRFFSNEVGYFLANTTDETVLACLNDEDGEVLVYISYYLPNEENSGEDKHPTILARIENHNQDELILLGIGYDYDKNEERIYFRVDKETNDFEEIDL